MNRRSFLKNTCYLCAAVGAGVTIGSLSSCVSVASVNASPENGIISVPLSQWPPDKNVLLIKSQKLEYNILVVKKGENNYHVLQMKCTHNLQPLSPTENKIFCNTHGAEFDLNGKVLKGPADKPLHSRIATLSENILKIDCTGL